MPEKNEAVNIVDELNSDLLDVVRGVDSFNRKLRTATATRSAQEMAGVYSSMERKLEEDGEFQALLHVLKAVRYADNFSIANVMDDGDADVAHGARGNRLSELSLGSRNTQQHSSSFSGNNSGGSDERESNEGEGDDSEDQGFNIMRAQSEGAMKSSGLNDNKARKTVNTFGKGDAEMDSVMDTSFLNVVFLPQLMQKLLCRALRDQLRS